MLKHQNVLLACLYKDEINRLEYNLLYNSEIISNNNPVMKFGLIIQEKKNEIVNNLMFNYQELFALATELDKLFKKMDEGYAQYKEAIFKTLIENNVTLQNKKITVSFRYPNVIILINSTEPNNMLRIECKAKEMKLIKEEIKNSLNGFHLMNFMSYNVFNFTGEVEINSSLLNCEAKIKETDNNVQINSFPEINDRTPVCETSSNSFNSPIVEEENKQSAIEPVINADIDKKENMMMLNIDGFQNDPLAFSDNPTNMHGNISDPFGDYIEKTDFKQTDNSNNLSLNDLMNNTLPSNAEKANISKNSSLGF